MQRRGRFTVRICVDYVCTVVNSVESTEDTVNSPLPIDPGSGKGKKSIVGMGLGRAVGKMVGLFTKAMTLSQCSADGMRWRAVPQ